MATKIEINIREERNNCTVLEVTKNIKGNTLVIVECNECKRQFKVLGYNYTKSKFMCNHGKRLLAEEFVNKTIGSLHIDKVVGRSEIDNRTVVDVTCTNCGEQYAEIHWHRITSFSFQCDCTKRNKYESIVLNKYRKYIGNIRGTDKIVGVNYYKDNDANNRCKFSLECMICHTKREVSTLAFLDTSSYKKCNCMPKTREVKDHMKKYRETLINKKFGLLTVRNFVDGTTLQNIVAICECECGNDHFMTRLGNIVSGDTRTCGCKTKSGAVKLIENTLKSLNVDFTEEQQMKDLLSDKGRRLKFDFFIKDKRGIGIAVIEYDGPHHQKPFNYGHWNSDRDLEAAFEQIQKNDRLKDEYVKAHGCKMLRIKYKKDATDEDIEQQVKRFINVLNI